MSKTWFITGTSRGFGRRFAEAALERGDNVSATARNPDVLSDLVAKYGDTVLPIGLDVTDRDQVFEAVAATREKFGRLDVVVNNAGYALNGTVEEITPDLLREQLETNLFGVLHGTQAALPIMREQGSGHIIQTSSFGGVVSFPTLGGYNASKWALEGLSDALAQEVAAFGIKVTLIEPAPFLTDFFNTSAVQADENPAYDGLRERFAAARAGQNIPEPVSFGPAILKLVDAEKPPLRVLFGEFPTQYVPSVYQQRLDTWDEWKELALEAEGK
jgi:NAD(P)-dependent dehydrogenase (short-subunit alcohol dehydrogenase family)